MNKEDIDFLISIQDLEQPEFDNACLERENKRLNNIINKAIINITTIFRDENWFNNYDYDDLVIALKDTLGILRGDKE